MGSAHSVWTTLVLLQLTMACAFPVYTSQAPSCYAGELSEAVPVFWALPGLRISGHQVLGKCSAKEGHSS